MSAEGPSRRRTGLLLTLQVATRSRALPGAARFERWARAALRRRAQVTLRLVGEREGALLNRDYRGKAHATNVLTFCYEGKGGSLAGDIVLCAPVIRREARAQRKTLNDHYAHLLAHALLHLQGYDHENERDARAMEAREAVILRRLGIADPYAEPTLPLAGVRAPARARTGKPARSRAGTSAPDHATTPAPNRAAGHRDTNRDHGRRI